MSAVVSTTAPRLVLTRIAPSWPQGVRIDQVLRLPGSGTCTLTKSDAPRRSSSSRRSTPGDGAPLEREVASSRTSKPRSSSATRRPMRPKPTSPTVAPASSRPIGRPRRSLPLAAANRGIRLGDPPSGREHQGDRELGGRAREDTGGVRDPDPACTGSFEVDVVVADPEVRHHLERAAGLVEQIGIDRDARVGHDPGAGRLAAGLDDEPLSSSSRPSAGRAATRPPLAGGSLSAHHHSAAAAASRSERGLRACCCPRTRWPAASRRSGLPRRRGPGPTRARAAGRPWPRLARVCP